MRIKNLKFIFLMILSNLFVCLSVASTYDEYKQGLDYLSAGDLNNSELHLEKAKEKYPHSYYLLGVIAEKENLYQKAIQSYTSFLSFTSVGDELYYTTKAHMAYCFALIGNESSTTEVLKELDAKVIDDKVVALLYGDASFYLADKMKSVYYAKIARDKYSLVFDKLDLQNSEALNGYARASLLTFDIQAKNNKGERKYLIDGLDKICKAIKKKPNAYYYINKGAIYYKLNDWDSSSEAFRTAIGVAGNNTQAIKKATKNLQHVEAMLSKFPKPKITPIRCE